MNSPSKEEIKKTHRKWDNQKYYIFVDNMNDTEEEKQKDDPCKEAAIISLGAIRKMIHTVKGEG